MPGARLPMRKIRDVLRLTAAGMSEPQDRGQLSASARRQSVDCLRRARRCRRRLAAARRPDRRGAGGAAVSGLDGAGRDQGPAPTARLAGDPSRAEAAGRDAAAGLGGASRRPPRGLRLQPVLRAVSGLGRPAVADDAADPCRRREAVRRLRRHDAGGDRRDDRRGADRAAVRRRARRVELHLGRGDLDAEAPRLDRLAHARLCLFRRRAGDGGVRQSEVRHHQGLLLRAGGEPQLRRDGGPLRHGDRSGAALQAARQGQGRGRPCSWRRAGSSPSCAIASSSRSPS